MPRLEFHGGSSISCDNEVAAELEIEVGPDVVIECQRLSLGRGVKIGVSGENGFRLPGGVRIRASELILGDGLRIDRQVLIRGGHIEIGRGTRVDANSTIHVKRQLLIGPNGTIGEQCEISGVDVVIGRQLWMLPQAKIGGGSAFEVHSRLRIGNWCHLGVRTLLNTARPILVGDEVGLGTGTCLYTHGAYASALEGKPVAFGSITVGDRTWIPGAIVNPSVSIGKDCLIGVGSVVTRSVPDGCLAAGIPAKILKENAYPSPLTGSFRFAFFTDFLRSFSEICADRWKVQFEVQGSSIVCSIADTHLAYYPEFGPRQLSECRGHAHAVVLTDRLAIDPNELSPNFTLIECTAKSMFGNVTQFTERLLNQLRRYGVRFNYESVGGRYEAWDDVK